MLLAILYLDLAKRSSSVNSQVAAAHKNQPQRRSTLSINARLLASQPAWSKAGAAKSLTKTESVLLWVWLECPDPNHLKLKTCHHSTSCYMVPQGTAQLCELHCLAETCLKAGQMKGTLHQFSSLSVLEITTQLLTTVVESLLELKKGLSCIVGNVGTPVNIGSYFVPSFIF